MKTITWLSIVAAGALVLGLAITFPRILGIVFLLLIALVFLLIAFIVLTYQFFAWQFRRDQRRLWKERQRRLADLRARASRDPAAVGELVESLVDALIWCNDMWDELCSWETDERIMMKYFEKRGQELRSELDTLRGVDRGETGNLRVDHAFTRYDQETSSRTQTVQVNATEPRRSYVARVDSKDDEGVPWWVWWLLP